MNITFDFSPSMSPEFGNSANQCCYVIRDCKINTYDDDLDFKSLDGLSLINLFVGANNSGKSRFLRGLFKTTHRNYKISSDNIDINFLANQVDDFYKKNINEILSYERTLGKEM